MRQGGGTYTLVSLLSRLASSDCFRLFFSWFCYYYILMHITWCFLSISVSHVFNIPRLPLTFSHIRSSLQYIHLYCPLFFSSFIPSLALFHSLPRNIPPPPHPLAHLADRMFMKKKLSGRRRGLMKKVSISYRGDLIKLP